MVVKPGFKIGAEMPIRTVQRTKAKANGKIRIVENQLYGTLNMWFSHTKGFNNALVVNTEFAYRKIRKCGFKTEVGIGIGLMRTFLDGTTYEVDNEGSVSIDKWAGSYFFLPSLSCGIGYNFENKHPNIPLTATLKPSLFFQTPFNSYSLPHIAVELGFSYKLKRSLFGLKTKKIYKSKVKK